MKKPFLIVFALAAAPFAAQAETWNIYGWQNHSWEFIDVDGGRSYDRTQSNAGNIGFAGSVDTGMNGIHVNVQCEQFTFYNHFGGFGDWCNRNSKIGLSHPQMGEVMIATWLLPYNEGVAQWVDPFYDAGADSHTSIMGSVGAGTLFYNAGFGFAGPNHLGFNRRQENIIQYWSPNWNGFVFRFAWTVGNNDETPAKVGSGELDPVIRSSSLAYTNGPLWLAVTWQDHEDWTAFHVGEMASSDAESFRVAGRYIMDLGDGMSVQISAMWEDLEYEFNGVTSVDAAMKAFGYGDTFMSSGNLTGYDMPGDPFMRAMYEGTPFAFAPDDNEDGTPNAHKTALLQQKTLGLLYRKATDTSGVLPTVWEQRADGPDGTADTDDDILTYTILEDDGDSDTTGTAITLVARVAPTGSDTIQEADDAPGNDGTTIFDMQDDDESTANVDESTMLTANAQSLKTYLESWGKVVAALEAKETKTDAETAYIKTYNDVVAAATAEVDMASLRSAHDMAEAAAKTTHESEQDTAEAAYRAAEDAKTFRSEIGGNVKIERDAWMVSGKIKFGGPVDFRFSYMDADDLEVSCSHCSGDWDETAADAWNVGIFYTMPAGTELRLTYSEVDNDTNGSYDFGIGGAGVGTGGEVEMFGVGIVHWFD